MKKSEKILLTLLAALLLTGAIVFGGIWAHSRYAAYLENRRHPVSREEIESKPAMKRLSSTVFEGTVDGHPFQLVMRGFTNYFLKEKWGAERGQHYFFGGQKPGGYKVTIRAENFSGEWSYGWHDTGGGGGGSGFDEYQDDILPGRWLWNRNGFVGAQTNYEYHTAVRNYPVDGVILDAQSLEEEYRKCETIDNVLIPKEIIWTVIGKHYGYDPTRRQRIFCIRNFRFQADISEKWFGERVKEYFSDYAHFKTTNRPPSVSTGQSHTGGTN